MKSITIHNMTDELSRIIEKLARENNASLNKTIKSLLYKATGLREEGNKNENLNQFFNTMSATEVEEFLANTKDFSRIDPKEWK